MSQKLIAIIGPSPGLRGGGMAGPGNPAERAARIEGALAAMRATPGAGPPRPAAARAERDDQASRRPAVRMRP